MRSSTSLTSRVSFPFMPFLTETELHDLPRQGWCLFLFLRLPKAFASLCSKSY